MFVRFRASPQRLQVSLAETSRTNGKVRQEHVASLGSVPLPMTVAGRAEFWQHLHERLGQLSNRIDTNAQGKLLGQVHARVPMVTVEEIQDLQLENVESDERLWSGLRDLHAETAGGYRELLASIQQAISAAEAQAEAAGAKSDAAKDKVRRLRNGDPVSGGLGKQLTQDDFRQILRDAGWTAQDIEHSRVVNALSERGGFDEYLAEVQKRHRRAEYAAARGVLRRLSASRD